MRRVLVGVVTAVLAGTTLVAPPASAATHKYKNCAVFNEEYPRGVAKTAAAAQRAVSRGYQRPRVSSRLFKEAVKWNPRLGTPADRVLCEVPVPKTPPSEPLGLTAALDAASPASAITLTWRVPANDGNAAITGYEVSDGTRSFTTPDTSYTVTDLAAETRYQFTVRALNAIGASPPVYVTASTAVAKLLLPANSGWQLSNTGTYLRADATPGLVLPLGNAPALGIAFYGSTCSGEWYESAFVGVEFLDGGGNVLPGPYGFGKELLGYLAGTSDFNSSGCGGETVDLDRYPGAVSVRVVSSGGSIRGSVALFAGRHL